SYYITGQLTRINVNNGNTRKIGKPAMIKSISEAPSGKYTIVNRLVKPFSYIVPVSRFASRKEIWSLDGDVMTLLQKRAVNKGIPDSSIAENYGRKDIQWRPDGKGLSLIATPVKHQKKENNRGDQEAYRVIQWTAPFGKNDQQVLYSTDKKINSVSYTEGADVLFMKKGSYKKGQLFAVYLDDPDTSFTIYKYKREGFYRGGKKLLQKRASTGLPAIQLSPDKQSVFLSGI